MIIDGKKIAEEIMNGLQKLEKPKKFFAAVLVGENPESVSFLKQKEKVAKEIGVDFRLYSFSAEIKQDTLRKEVLKIVNHKTCGGVIVQLPLPEHINRHYVLNAIPREKDIDVLGERALGAFYTGRNPVLPPAVGVLIKILDYIEGDSSSLRKVSRSPSGHGSPQSGESEGESQGASETLTSETPSFRVASLSRKKVAVVGRGFLIGRPIAMYLMNKVAELVVFTSKTDNLREKLRNFDIVISGVGKENVFSAEDLKDGAFVVDFGYSKNAEGKLVGDFNPSSAENIFYTPTPGGTGPILVAKLFENFYALCKFSDKSS